MTEVTIRFDRADYKLECDCYKVTCDVDRVDSKIWSFLKETGWHWYLQHIDGQVRSLGLLNRGVPKLDQGNGQVRSLGLLDRG